MRGILTFVTIMVATVSLAEAQSECEVPGECVGQIVGFVQEDDVTRKNTKSSEWLYECS